MSEMELAYEVDRSVLPYNLSNSFVQSPLDSGTKDFMAACRLNPHSHFQVFLENTLSLVIPDYEVHGLLHLYPMHLLSRNNWSGLIKEKRDGTLLDVGAGQGFVTAEAKRLFSKIYTTETSHSMANTLRRMGFECFEEDLGKNILPTEERFDVISILNVLDRCDYPLSLLKNCIRMLKNGGYLLIAVPLPLHPLVRMAAVDKRPVEPLPSPGNVSWETCFLHFYEHVIKTNNLELVRWTRLPYLWKTTRPACVEGLDDAVMACKVAG